MTPKNLSDAYLIAILEIARLVVPVETRKTGMNLVQGNEIMTKIRKIIASVEQEEDRCVRGNEDRISIMFVFRPTIRAIHEWVTFKRDDLDKLEELLYDMSGGGYEGESIELYQPDFDKATLKGMREIIKVCQDEIDKQMRETIGVE